MSEHYNRVETDYLGIALDYDSRKTTIQKLISSIKDSNVEFDCVAFRGVSGALFGPVVADHFNKGMAIIRKDKSHSFCNVEYSIKSKSKNIRYIIVDDFIETGTTINEIIKGMKGSIGQICQVRCAGIFLYKKSSGRFNQIQYKNITIYGN